MPEIKPKVVYRTIGGQSRKVIRVTRSAVHYEVIGEHKPFYRFSVAKDAFVAEVETGEQD